MFNFNDWISQLSLKFYTVLLDFKSLEDDFHLSFHFLNSTFVFDIPRCTFATRCVKITVEPFIFDSTHCKLHIGNFQLDFRICVYASVIIGREWEGRGGGRPLPQALLAFSSFGYQIHGRYLWLWDCVPRHGYIQRQQIQGTINPWYKNTFEANGNLPVHTFHLLPPTKC